LILNYSLLYFNFNLLDIHASFLSHNVIVVVIIIFQIKREISIMKLVRHPYVVRLNEAGYLSFEVLNLDINSTVIIILHET
jgi:hypothetical protein